MRSRGRPPGRVNVDPTTRTGFTRYGASSTQNYEERVPVPFTTSGRTYTARMAATRRRLSAWFVSIGTHTHVGDDQAKFEDLKRSLERALDRVFNRYKNTRNVTVEPEGQEFYKIFFPTPLADNNKLDPVYNRMTELKRYVQENPQIKDQILNDRLVDWTDAIWVIEKGTKQKRVDAHIMLRVRHTGKIMLDPDHLEMIIREELKEENEEMQREGLPDDRFWKGLEGTDKLYLNIRNLGQFDEESIARYMAKQQLPVETELEAFVEDKREELLPGMPAISKRPRQMSVQARNARARTRTDQGAQS